MPGFYRMHGKGAVEAAAYDLSRESWASGERKPRPTDSLPWRDLLKIVVIGGSGLIGKKLVSRLRALGHEVTAASPSSGVDAVTGEGLAESLAGARVVVDVSNSPSFE